MKNHPKAWNKKNRIIKSYNSSAHFYDKRYKLIQETKYTRVFNKNLLKEKRILDIGCGTGLLLEYILKYRNYKRKYYLNYVAIDISLEMLREFQAKLFDLKDKVNVSLVLSDIEKLPFRDNRFTLIFSFTSYQNLPNCTKGIQELVRVALNGSDLKFSILKKNRELDALVNLLRPYLKKLEIDNEDFLEDMLIQGKISKE